MHRGCLQFTLAMLFAAACQSTDGATLTISGSTSGSTPDRLGYNLGHYMDGSNASDWFRYSGAKAARIFISVSDIEPTDDISPVGDGVDSESAFFSRRAALRANAASKTATLSSTYVKWSTFSNNYKNVSSGNNQIKLSYALSQLRAMGVDVLANITASPNRFPITVGSSTEWGDKWELWQHFYAQAFLLSRDYGVTRFSIFNEPNGYTGMTPADWLMRLRLCSDAIQCAVADMNSRYSKSLQAQVLAPNTANGFSKYNTLSDTWGYDAINNRHLQLNGTSSASWNNFHAYNYQKYTTLTNDSGGSSGYIEDLAALRTAITNDMAPEAALPIGLTEFNVRTGDSYDLRPETLDDPGEAVALAANCIALAQNDTRFLYLFKFGQTANDAAYYGVAKNGTHYVDNSTASTSLNNYGGATKGAEVYRLFNKAAGAGRAIYPLTGSTGATPTTTAGVWSLATRDISGGFYYFFIANKNTSSISLDLDLSSLGLVEGTPVTVEEVSAASLGGISRVTTVTGGKVPPADLLGQSVWLVSVPDGATVTSQVAADMDTQLGDGAFSSTVGGSTSQMLVRDDGTSNGRRVVYVRFPIPAGSPKLALLNLSSALSSGTAPIQAHVYGVNGNDAWDQATATWTSLTSGSLAPLKAGMSAGDNISHNVVANQGTVTQIQGQLLVSSTNFSEQFVDVTSFVKSQSDGFATFLVVQDHRWDVALPSLSSGDIQPAGILLSAKDANGGSNTTGPRLITVGGTNNVTPSAPFIVSRPQSQNISTGGTATFSVSVNSTPAVTYQWKKDGVNIPGATGASVTGTAAGFYTVAVTNSTGTTTSSAAVLTVTSPPAITSAPLSQTVTVGDTVTLTAAASGTPTPSFQWSKDGIDIPGAISPTYSFVSSSTAESGTYTVTASNMAGSASSSALVTVNAASQTALLISSTAFSYNQNFDNQLEKSAAAYSVSGTTFATWTDNTILGWYAATDASPFQGYRTTNASNGKDFGSHPTSSQAGLLSMGSTSSDPERALGGLAWTNNSVYLGFKLTNKTGLTLDRCTLSYALEQYTATTAALNTSSIILSTQVAAAGLKSGTWQTRQTNVPWATKTSYTQVDGNKSAYRTVVTVNLSGLNVPPNQDLWLRWTVSTTSSDPVAIGIDDVSVTQLAGSAPAVAPAFELQPQGQTATVGDSVTFSASATGNPTPSYQWKKDGVPLAGGTNASYSIPAVAAGDAGNYTVTATNSAGSITSDAALLFVATPPAITSQPQSQTALVGGTATFSASASGSPTPTYQWQKDGVDILGATGASLTISPITLADAGSYTVTANNVADSALSNPAVLTVYQLPSFITHPAGQTVNAGQSVTFSAEATGIPTPTYKWQKDGADIPGATTANYSIPSVTAQDAGSYRAVATNLGGSTYSNAAQLQLATAPVLVTSPTTQRVVAGGTATFAASFTGTPTPTLQWYKDGALLQGATNSSYTVVTTATSDAGLFSVTATNMAGGASGSASLIVYPLGINIFSGTDIYTQNFSTLQRSGSYTVRSGTYATWTDNSTLVGWFAATDRTPFYGYRTVNTGATTPDFGAAPLTAQSGLVSSGTGSGSTERSLGGLPWSDNKIYFAAKLVNRTGATLNGCTIAYTVEQNSATISSTTSKIDLSTQVNAADIKSGTWAAWQTTYPPATSATYSNISGNVAANRTVQTGTLTNLNVGNNQELWVRWTVSTNSTSDPVVLGIDDLTISGFQTTPEAAPAFSLQPQSQTLIAGQTLTLTGSVTGSPTPALQWLKNGAPIGGATSGTYELVSVAAVDSGTYSLQASNSAGTATSNAAIVTIQVPPFFLSVPVSQTVTLGDTVSMNVLVGGSPAPTLNWKKNSVIIAGGTGATYSIAAAALADSGTYMVTANNAAGTTNSIPAVLTVITRYANWRNQQFGANAAIASISDDAADPDGDGLCNLAEYALGTAALVSDIGTLTLSVDGTYLNLTYPRSVSANDVTVRPCYTLELGPNASWISTGIVETKISDNGVVQIWKASLPLTTGSKAFLRLQISSP